MEFPNRCYSGVTADGKMILTEWYRAFLADCDVQADVDGKKMYRCACDGSGAATDSAEDEDPLNAFYRELQRRYDEARGQAFGHVEIPAQLGDIRENAERTQQYGQIHLLQHLQARADARRGAN
jgi:hypothetical protein